MVLQKQILDVALNGLELGIDKKLVGNGGLLECENVEWEKDGQIKKRAGYTRVVDTSPAWTPDDGNISSVHSDGKGFVVVDEFANITYVDKDELTPKYIYGTVSRFPTKSITVDPPSVTTGKDSVSSVASVVIGERLIIAFQSETNNAVYIMEVSKENGTVLMDPSVVVGGTSKCVVRLAVSNSRHLYLMVNKDATTIETYYCDALTEAWPFSSATAVQSSSSVFGYDILGVQNKDYAIAAYTTGTGLKSCVITKSSGKSSEITNSGHAMVADTDICLSNESSTNKIYAIYTYSSDGGTTSTIDTWTISRDASLGTISESSAGASISSASSGVRINKGAMVWTLSGTEYLVVCWSYSGGTNFRVARTTTSSMSLSSPSASPGFFPITAPFVLGTTDEFDSDQYKIWVGCTLTSQGSDFLSNRGVTLYPISTENYGNGAYSQYSLPCRVSVDSDAAVAVSLSYGGYIYSLSGNSKVISVISVSKTERSARFLTVLGTTIMARGTTTGVVGWNKSTPVSFVTYPNISLSSSSTGGSLSDGVYSVCAVFERNDGNGVRSRSSVSISSQITLSAGTATQKITVSVSGRFSASVPNGETTAVYCTEAGGTVYYRSQEGIGSSIVITAVSSANEALYTTGGVLENFSPRGVIDICAKGDRVYLVTKDGEIYYSKQLVVGEEIAFSEFLKIDYPGDGGDDYSIIDLDDTVVVFGTRSIYAFTGSGADPTGANSDLSRVRPIQTTGGKKRLSTVFKTDVGVLFQGDNGYYVLDRSLAVNNISRMLDMTKLGTVTSVAHIPGTKCNHIVAGGYNYIFSSDFRQWATTTLTAAQTVSLGEDFYLAVGKYICKRTPAAFLDHATRYSMKVTTPWIKVSGLAGYQRIYNVFITGEFKSSCKMNIVFYYDDIETAAETIVVDLTTGYTAGDPIEIRHNAGRRCKSMKLKVYDSDSDGASFTLSGISIEVGIKGGLYKLSSGKTV